MGEEEKQFLSVQNELVGIKGQLTELNKQHDEITQIIKEQQDDAVTLQGLI